MKEEKVKSFYIDDFYLYSEEVLIEYNDVPIFFLCGNEQDRYLALLVDNEQFNYVLVKMSDEDVKDLKSGSISMRDAIISHDKYIYIESGYVIEDDLVSYHKMEGIKEDWLPDTGIPYKNFNADC